MQATTQQQGTGTAAAKPVEFARLRVGELLVMQRPGIRGGSRKWVVRVTKRKDLAVIVQPWYQTKRGWGGERWGLFPSDVVGRPDGATLAEMNEHGAFAPWPTDAGRA